MRVLYLSPGHPSHDARFMEAIRALGHEPILAIIGAPIDLARAAERERPDVIHAGPLDTVARWATEAGARPLVSSSWGYDLLTPGEGSDLQAATTTLAGTDVLLVDCEAAQAVAVSLGMAVERIIELPWGADLERFRPPDASSRLAAREALGWNDATIVVCARAHEPIYGVDVAISGFLLAARSDPSLHLAIAGDGSLRPSLEALVGRSDVAERVRFVGRLDSAALARLLMAADLYVSPSHTDGSSVTLLEAMASGVPCVVSDIPGNQEWISPGQAGDQFRDGDPVGLAAAISRLAASPRTRATMGHAARQIVEERADWVRNRRRLDDAYDMAVRHAGT